MPLVYVGGRTGTWAGATSGNNNISLTLLTGGISSTAAIGDFVVAVYATGSAADRTLVIQDPSAVAYTLIDSERYANGTTYDSNLRVAYKRLTAADANTVFGPTGNAQDAGAAAVHVWRGVNSTTPLDVTAVGTQGTGTGRPNPPAITPTTTGAVVIATGGAAAATGALFVGTGLSNFITATSIDTNDGMVGVGSFAWTSGTYDPAAWTGGTANAADSWTSITLVLRPGATQTLTPNLYTNDQTFFSPTVTQTGASQTLTPSLYTNDQTFFGPTVSASNALTPALYSNDQTFYSPAVTQSGGPQTLTPSLYTNAQTFFEPAITASNTLTPSLYTNEQTFYAPTITTSVTLTPVKYDNAQTFYLPVISQTGGVQTLLPSLYENAQTFYEPTVNRGTVNLDPELYSNAQSFYAPDVTTATALLPSLFNNTQTFYSASISASGTQQDITFEDYADPGYVDSGYVTWVAGFQSGNEFFASTLQQFAQRGEGWAPQINRKRKWSEDRDERDDLRKLIERTVNPIQAPAAKVVTVKDKITVIPEGGDSVSFPIPPSFDPRNVARMVVRHLERMGVDAQRTRQAQARAQARIVIERIRAENERRLRKRRRDEEILLLM